MAGKDGKGNYTTVNNAKVEAMDEEGVGLKASLGLVQGCTIIIGSIIGSGIFIAPGGVLKEVGSINMSITVWVISGLFSMIGAYCYAELGLLIRKPGGDYTYILDTLGPFIGFIRLWAECLIVRPCTITIVALTFSKYAVKLLFPECNPPYESERMLAAACICLLTFVNCWEVKWATFVQDIFTYAKLLALFIIIATGFVQLGRGKVENFTWDDTETDVRKIALSFYSGLFAYNGWNYLNFVIEELQDPVRNLPRAISISCVLVTVVYVLVNIAFYTTLSIPEVLGSEAVAVTFAERLYGNFAFMIPVFVAMSTFGGVNGILLTSSRLFYAGACEGQMPEILSMIQVIFYLPCRSTGIIHALLSLVYLCSSDIYALINYVGFATWVSIGLAVFCLPWLRWKHPEWERPIKVHLIFPIIYIICTIFITVVPMIASPIETGIGIAIIATGVPVYFVFIAWKNKPPVVLKFIGLLTIVLQKMLLVVPKETD
ncbi:Y+L amino acid transporter 2 [Eurytemora carolleeae]|uniref:Y+L amino acid transporter 2 n=1 Tax=Eurytemora carolleeae TaxID=1294199 RepID=UPI000C762BC7|nr:Y+L amino acid transporter 2 [Eurytemora carolleeae]|eukprot:XP_023329398.1 Y+L amino acid transporter 2-like [Eurytemora affinis]